MLVERSLSYITAASSLSFAFVPYTRYLLSVLLKSIFLYTLPSSIVSNPLLTVSAEAEKENTPHIVDAITQTARNRDNTFFILHISFTKFI